MADTALPHIQPHDTRLQGLPVEEMEHPTHADLPFGPHQDRSPTRSPASSIHPGVHQRPSDPESDDAERRLGEIRLIKFEKLPPLKWIDVAALIITKMVGTGILTGPPTVLLYTGSKRVAMVLWVGGFLYTLISMTVFLEYARKMPHTGGELIYVAEIYPKPALLAYTIYGIYFVFFNLTTSNSLQFARQVILAAAGGDQVKDTRLLRVFAVSIMLIVSLLLYFSMATGKKLNRLFAIMKLVLLFTIFCAGAALATRNPAGDMSKTIPASSSGIPAAIFLVLFSFQGWENATLVAGEIPDNKTLRKGFIFAVWTVGILYLLINIVYFAAIPWPSNDIPKSQYAPLFFSGEKSVRAFQILTAFSAVGSMLSVSYTAVRVKHTIAWTNILPWSSFWRRSAPVRQTENGQSLELARLTGPERANRDVRSRTIRTGTPEGAILLHFITTSVATFYSYRIKSITEAIPFTGNLQTYGHAVTGLFLGLRFHWLFIKDPKSVRYIQHSDPSRGWKPGSPAKWLSSWEMPRIVGYLSSLLNLLMVILPFVLLKVRPNAPQPTVKSWWNAAIIFPLILLSGLYYLAFIREWRWSALHLGGVYADICRHGVDDKFTVERQCDLCETQAGQRHRHARNGYLEYLSPKHYRHRRTPAANVQVAGEAMPRSSAFNNYMYWLFGGTKNEYYPDFRIDDLTEAVLGFPKRVWDRFWSRRQQHDTSYQRQRQG